MAVNVYDWTILYLLPKGKCVCKCKCGRIFIRLTKSIMNGQSKMCYLCNNKITAEKNRRAFPRHGKRLYRIWCGIKSRCYNSNYPKYPWYGGRGITMCNEWKNDFVSFEMWANANGYNDNLSIDRIDNNKNYCPMNCRWADAHTQNTNQNIRKDNKTGFVGVSYHGGKYVAGIRINNKQVWLGCSFNSAEEACIARDRFIIDNNLTEYKTQIIKRGIK